MCGNIFSFRRPNDPACRHIAVAWFRDEQRFRCDLSKLSCFHSSGSTTVFDFADSSIKKQNHRPCHDRSLVPSRSVASFLQTTRYTAAAVCRLLYRYLFLFIVFFSPTSQVERAFGCRCFNILSHSSVTVLFREETESMRSKCATGVAVDTHLYSKSE